MIARLLSLALAPVIALAACARTPAPAEADSTQAATASVPAPVPASPPPTDAPQVRPDTTLPHMVVHKSPTCGCCELWVEHMRDAGFKVEVRNSDNLNPLKEQLGIPYGKGSCHTAEVGGYFVEGHVPAEDVKRLLAQKPQAKGLVLPGMPLGSPGMEVPDGTVQRYTVELVDRQGASTVFAQH